MKKENFYLIISVIWSLVSFILAIYYRSMLFGVLVPVGCSFVLFSQKNKNTKAK